VAGLRGVSARYGCGPVTLTATVCAAALCVQFCRSQLTFYGLPSTGSDGELQNGNMDRTGSTVAGGACHAQTLHAEVTINCFRVLDWLLPLFIYSSV